MLRFRPSTLLLLCLAAALAVPARAQQVPLDALMRGGRIHYDGQRFERAREQFKKALDQYGATVDNPALAEIHKWIGLSEAQLRNFPAAADHIATALEKDPTQVAKISKDEQWQYHAWTALINTTREDYNAGRYEPALRYALAAMQIDPAKPQTYALVANIYSALARYDDMHRIADDLLKLDSSSPEAFGLKGLYFLQKPDSLWTPQARSVRWDSTGYYYNQAIAQYEQRFAKAQDQLGQTLKIADRARVEAIAWQLISRSRAQDQAELKRYIEQDLKAARQLTEVAQAASQLYFSANNLNAAASRAGTAMLRAAAETRGDTSEKYRAQAEVLFNRAVAYDSTDFTALFDLGIAQYQGRKDSLAELTLQRVVTGSTVPAAELPADVLGSVLAQVTPAAAQTGYLQLTGPIAGTVDSVLAAKGYRAGSYSWLYVPDLRDKKDFTVASPNDAATMFLSIEPPQLLEQAYLWLGSSQTGLATAMDTLQQKQARTAKLNAAIANLMMGLKITPNNAEAYQNLGICYRELGQKDKALKAFETADKIRKQK